MPADKKITCPFTIRHLQSSDTGRLLQYLNNLGAETKSRFGPHEFTAAAIEAIYNCGEKFTGYTAVEQHSGNIIAYAIVKKGFLQHDSERLERYGMLLSNETDCTLAPSVADEWQGLGVGKQLFDFIAADVKAAGFKRIILWGGVQISNYRAVQYYTKNGFTILGQFEYNGLNMDMSCSIA